MTDTSARFALPLLAPGQAQKELFHNEALALVDAIAHPLAQTFGATTPPSSPASGQCWIVGASPVGDWAGHANALACRTEGGWRFVMPVEGMAVWIADRGVAARWLAGAWQAGDVAATRLLVGGQQVVGARRPAVAAPSGGTTVDAQARTTLSSIISALVAHGLIAA